VRRVFGQEFEIPADDVTPEARLVDDLDLDSVDAVTLALRLEEETGLELTEAELKSLDTVASLVTLVRRRLEGRTGLAS